MCVECLGNVCGISMEKMGLKAPGNYYASFGSYNFSILLSERPKPNVSMISGCLDPWEHLFMDLNIPNQFKESKKFRNAFPKKYV